MNFAKRCCADDANLCEIISVSPDENSQSKEFIEDVLKKNRFDVRYREQLEKTAADGTVGAYIYLKNAEFLEQSNGTVTIKGGDIRINYCEADNIIPLTVENGLVTECAFGATNTHKGKKRTTLVIFTINDRGNYEAETVYFDANGHLMDELTSVLVLGEVKPFAIMTNAEVNNLDDMEGYGLPKIYNTIPMFMAADLCFNILFGDLDKGEKMVFINELLACIQREDGVATLTPQQKKLFVLLGEKLPSEDSLVKEYNPEIRVDDITKSFELILSLISLQFGYGTKKYSFENGQIQTATQYIGERQDEMQELNRQRKQAEEYIDDIIHAAMWFSNQFHETTFDVEEELIVEFDDSFIEDKATTLENMRNDALSFPNIPWLTTEYIKARYNLTDDEIEEIMANSMEDEEEYDDDEDIESTFDEGTDGDIDLDSLLAELEAM